MTIVQTTFGALRGSAGITQFRGIIYATAERFRPPVPVTTRHGTRDARRDGPIAPQQPSRHLYTRAGAMAAQDEDCLSLSVATPAMPPNPNTATPDPDFAARPVVVFIHGGGYATGAGSSDLYDPAIMCADSDLVVVKPNYRLGALGFLYFPGVAEGNMGLLDIVAALRWVQANITHFGGDPDNVTVIGHEAGAHALMCLLTMWDSQGLFHRAVLASCPTGVTPQSRDTGRRNAIQLCDAVGFKPEELTGLSSAQIIEAQSKVARGARRFADIEMTFMPMFEDLHDDADATKFIAATAKAAANRGIQVIIGTTREELHAVLANDSLILPPSSMAIANRFAEVTGSPDIITLYRHRRAGGSDYDLLGDLMTDHLFLFPSLAFADALTQAGGLAWVYQFDWAPRDNRLRACQGIDIACLFGNAANWSDTGILDGADPGEFSSIGSAMRAALGEFAHTNDPDAPGLPWPPYRRPNRITMRFDTALGPVGDLAGAGWRLAE